MLEVVNVIVTLWSDICIYRERELCDHR